MKPESRFKLFFYIILRTIIALTTLGLPVGCAVRSGPVFIKNGKKFGQIEGIWGGNFWDYYSRGLSYSEGEFWSESLDDFQQAIRLRRKDQRLVRTYGLHILDDYFPSREMGIAYYTMAEYQKAIDALSFSLSCYSSAKAQYYLDLAREALLRKTNQDIKPPNLLITSHRDQEFVAGFETSIEGRAEDDHFVKEITVNEIPYLLELAEPTINFSLTIPLRPGLNEIKAMATDLTGKNSFQYLRLIADQQAPLLYVKDIKRLKSDKVEKGLDLIKTEDKIQLIGYVHDLCGVKRVQIAEQPITLSEGDRGDFVFQGLIPYNQESLPFIAEDQLGNRVAGKIRISDDHKGTESVSRPLIRLASLKLAEIPDTSPPAIVIDAPSQENLIVDWETLFINGEVQDAIGLRDLLINEESILPGDEGKKIYFNYIVRLQPGQNIISIKAIDLAGNQRVKTLNIERTINPIYQVGSRMSVAITPFKYRGEEPEQRQFIADNLTLFFVDQERFCMVDRERIDRIVDQLKDGNPDEPQFSPLELGKLVSAETVLAGSIHESNGLVEIVARLIDTETSVILDTQDVYGVSNRRNIQSMLEGLALKFKHSFPIVEGMIIEKDGENILVNLGREKNIKEFTKYIVFREGEPIKDPVTGQTLERKSKLLGEAKISKVLDKISEAELLKDDQMEGIKIKERVVTK